MNFRQGRTRDLLALTIFALVFASLTVWSYTRESATWDEPQFLLSGYLALHGDHRIVPEHPPFVQMWAALPLLTMPDINLPREYLPTAITDKWLYSDQYAFSLQFNYRWNDGDRLLYWSRLMVVLLGIGLGVILFAWARELFGFWTATLVLALDCAEPNLLAHSRLVTTDFGLTFFFCGTCYFLWRTTRAITWGNLLGLIVFFSMAQVSKFTGVLLGPLVLGLLLYRSCRRTPWICRIGRQRELRMYPSKALFTAGLVGLLALGSWSMIWAAYGFRYAPAPPPCEPMQAMDSKLATTHSFKLATILNWVDRQHLLPNLYTQGLITGQLKSQERAAYLAGEFRKTGWWYFFPVAFLIKTPLTILLLFFIGSALALFRRQEYRPAAIFLLVPVVYYMAIAMTSKLNIGLRHILPIYPFVLIICGFTIAELARFRRQRLALIAVGLAALEVAAVYPHYLAFFNVAVGGPNSGDKYLVDSNLDWGQDLKGLKVWMDQHAVKQVALCYFGMATPEYYGIRCTQLPGSMAFMEQGVVPQLPGYVAISATNLRGVYFSEQARNFYAPLLKKTPVARIGYSILVYRVERPWWE